MLGWRSVTCLCLLALALHFQHRLVEAGKSSDEQQSQQETCHDQCKETPSNNPHNRNYPCPLVNSLYYYATCDCVSQLPNHQNSVGFSASDKQALLDFIAALEVQLEAMGGNINDTSIVEVCLSMEVFFSAHVNIHRALSFLSMNNSAGVFFGTVQDFVNLHIRIQFDVIGPVLEVDSSGECELSKAIRAAAAGGNQQIVDECHNATKQIRSMLKYSEFNVTEQLSFIYQIILQECSVETIAFLKSNCHIAGFGSFLSIFKVCELNFRIQFMFSYMAGSSASDCDFLSDLQATWDATCFQGSQNTSQCSILGDFIDKIKLVFSSSVSIEIRMQQCSGVIFDFCKATPWICGIHLGRGGCSLYDIRYCSAFCHNEHCCNWNSSPPELPECSCDSDSDSGSDSDGNGSSDSSAKDGSSSDSGSDSNGDGSSDSSSAAGNSTDSDSGSDSNGDGDSDSSSAAGSGNSTSSDSGSDSNGDGDSDSSGTGDDSSSNSGSDSDGDGNSDSSDSGKSGSDSGSDGNGDGDSDSSGSGKSSNSGSDSDGDGNSDSSGNGSDSGSGTNSSSSSASDSASGETGVPCDGTGPCEPGETTVPAPAETTPEEPVEESTAPPATSEATTTQATTTQATTTQATTTTATAAPTTTPMSHCESRQRIIVVQASCNCSSLYLSIVQVTNTWSFTQKQSVAPVINQIQKILYDSSKTPAQKIAAIWAQLNGYNPTNTSWKTQFFAITIYEADMVTPWGVLGDFFTCGSSCTCSG